MVYLAKKVERGPDDGSKPSKVAVIVRSVELGVAYPELEERLAAVELKLAHGDPAILRENDRKWREVLAPLLVDLETAEAINGGRNRCNDYCLDEEEV